MSIIGRIDIQKEIRDSIINSIKKRGWEFGRQDYCPFYNFVRTENNIPEYHKDYGFVLARFVFYEGSNIRNHKKNYTKEDLKELGGKWLKLPITYDEYCLEMFEDGIREIMRKYGVERMTIGFSHNHVTKLDRNNIMFYNLEEK